MMRKKKASTSDVHTKRRRFESPIREDTVEPQPEPEYSKFDYEERCPIFKSLVSDEDANLTSSELIELQHELEEILANTAMVVRKARGEIQFLVDGEYPRENLRRRPMPVYELREAESPRSCSPTAILEKEGICGLPEEDSEELDESNILYHLPTTFWTWCRHDFLKNVDSDYLQKFKETFVDSYSNEEMQQYFVNEPWKYRKRNANTRKSTSQKTPKRVSIDVEATKSSNRKLSAAKINGHRSSEKGENGTNNNKIIPIIGSMVASACRDQTKSANETPARKKRGRLASRDESNDRKTSNSYKYEQIEVQTEEEDSADEDIVHEDSSIINGYENGCEKRTSPRLHSPRNSKKEDDEFNGLSPVNGNSRNGTLNGSHTNGKILNGSTKKNGKIVKSSFEEAEPLDSFDALTMGSSLVNKLIAAGIVHQSCAHVFTQITKTDTDLAETSGPFIDEEGRDEADDSDMDELSEELEKCQIRLQNLQPRLNAVVALAWRTAKAQYAYWHTFDQMRAADYDLFRLGVNMYREFPRRLPGFVEQPVLKEAMRRRNRLTRFHYGNVYRRHPKFRWRLKPCASSRKRSPS